MKSPPGPELRKAITRAFIIAYREDTTRLENELGEQGIETCVLRQQHDASLSGYSPQMLCLLNHASAWERSSAEQGLTLFIEADFVPCRNFGHLPLPFDPSAQGELAWSYIYAGGPRIYECLPSGHFLAHACSSVAYVMPPAVARLGLAYVEELRVRHPDWKVYYPWDTEIQWHLMGKGARAFVPWRQLGEHGGLPNPEHARNYGGLGFFRRALARGGIGINHRADALAAPLAFLPDYARGKRSALFKMRVEGRITGILRLLCGKMVAPLGPTTPSQRLLLAWHCARRMFA